MNVATLRHGMNQLRLALLLAALAFCCTGTPLQAAGVAAANQASSSPPLQAEPPQAGKETWRAAMAAPELALEAAYSVLTGSNTSITVAKQHLPAPVLSF